MMQDKHKLLFTRAIEHKKSKRFGEAILLLNKIIEDDNQCKEAYNEKGNILLILGRADEAIECFNIATRLDPKYIDAWRNKEAAYLLIGNYDEVIRCSDNVLKINPHAENLWINRGAMMATLHRYQESLECFDKALEINPKSRYAKYKKEEILKILNPKTKQVVRYTKKICLLGDPGVGKTSLIKRFVYDIFEDRYIISIGTKITKKVINLRYMDDRPNILLTLMIWDMAGQDDFHELRATYYQGSDGALLVCDLTRKETLYNINSWVNGLFKVTERIPIVILGNKSDLKIQHTVTEDELKNVAHVIGADCFLTSAKTGENVENAFSRIAQVIIQQQG